MPTRLEMLKISDHYLILSWIVWHFSPMLHFQEEMFFFKLITSITVLNWNIKCGFVKETWLKGNLDVQNERSLHIFTTQLYLYQCLIEGRTWNIKVFLHWELLGLNHHRHFPRFKRENKGKEDSIISRDVNPNWVRNNTRNNWR